MLIRLAETLVIGAAGGVALGLAGFPAGWLSGAILAVAVAAIAGRPMQVPPRLGQVIFVVIGTSLGGVATPETLHGVTTYPVSVTMMVLATAVISHAGAAYLRYVHGWDRVSAFLGAAPGAMSQVVAVAAELKADLRGIVVVQSTRVVFLAVGLPAGLVFLGFAGRAAGRVGNAFDPSLLGELALLFAISTTVAIIAYRTKFPGGLLFGSMLTSAVLHGSGLIHATVPWWFANAVMISLGSIVGARFANTPLRLLLNYFGAAIGSFAVAVAASALFAVVLVNYFGLHTADVMIAYAPGSVDAMMLLALTLHIDPVYVGAHHLARIFFVSLTMPLIARHAAGRGKAGDKSPDKPPPSPPYED